MKRLSPQSEAGFTLLELVVVMTILAIMTMMVMPVFRGTFNQTKIETAVDDLVATMQYAQSSAISEAVEYRLYLRPDVNAYWLARQSGTKDGEKLFGPVDDRYTTLTRLPAGLEFAKPKARKAGKIKGAYYVAFYPSGARDEATVVLMKDGSRTDTYEIATKGTASGFDIKRPDK